MANDRKYPGSLHNHTQYSNARLRDCIIKEEDLINELNKLGKEAIHISEHDEVVKYLKDNVCEGDIVLTLGAGNVTKIADKLIKS